MCRRVKRRKSGRFVGLFATTYSNAFDNGVKDAELLGGYDLRHFSYRDIDKIADSVLRRYGYADDALKQTDVRRLATESLGLGIEYATLSEDGFVLGLTAFAPTSCVVWRNGRPRLLNIPAGLILVDESLCHRDCAGRERFTIAHECGHQLLHGTDFARTFQTPVSIDAAESFVARRTLVTTNDWLEWQANTLAAALLMPQHQMPQAVKTFASKDHIAAEHGCITYSESKSINGIAEFYSVSFSALTIRLKQLGLLTGWDGCHVLHPLDIQYSEV